MSSANKTLQKDENMSCSCFCIKECPCFKLFFVCVFYSKETNLQSICRSKTLVRFSEYLFGEFSTYFLLSISLTLCCLRVISEDLIRFRRSFVLHGFLGKTIV